MKLSTKLPGWVYVLDLFVLISHGSPTCQDLTFSVSASAYNLELPSPLTWSTMLVEGLDFLLSLPTTLVSQTLSIAATFCEPENKVPHRHNTLQVLTHGLVS